MVKAKQPEKIIENDILDYMDLTGWLAWKVNNVGIYDPRKRLYRKPGKHFRKGIPDIMAIHRPCGLFASIEAKTLSGHVSPEQLDFLTQVTDSHGLAFIARSLEAAMERLKKHERECVPKNK